MSFVPVPDAPAILVNDRILAVADLHIGLEAKLNEAGVFLPSQTRKIARRLRELLESTESKTLVLLGDVKHFIPGVSPLERRDIPIFFNEILDAVDEVHIAAGNHDALIRPYVPEAVTIHKPTGFTIGDAGFVHGHAWPAKAVMESRFLLMGHNHPAVVFVDKLGGKNVQPCWVRAPFRRKHKKYPRLPREAVCVPSFNELCGGTPVNEARARLLGPLMQGDVLNLLRARLYLLDGTDLGPLPSLRVEARFRWSDYRQ